MRVLYDDILRYRPHEPKWRGRDRMILSKGHGCLALYVMLADKGFIPDRDARHVLPPRLDPRRPSGSRQSPGRRGLDRRARPRPLDRRRHGARRAHREARQPRHRGDGRRRDQRRLGVGSGAVRRQAPARPISRRVIDYNKIQSAGPTREIQDLEPLLDKWSASISPPSMSTATMSRRCATCSAALPLAADRPSAIICHTVKGKGIAFAENDRQLASQVEDRQRRAGQAVRALWSEAMRATCLNMVYELAKRDERVAVHRLRSQPRPARRR